MRKLIAVALLTASQFTAFPFIAMVATNAARHDVEQRVEQPNVTVVYKTGSGRGSETL